MRKVLPYVVCGALAFSFSTLSVACEQKASAKGQLENTQMDADSKQAGFHKVAKKRAHTDKGKGKNST